MFDINLNWKSFNVSLSAVQLAVEALITSVKVAGLSANSSLQIHCEFCPTDAEIAAVKSYWESLTAESPEVVNYKSQSAIKEEQLALKASAVSKLKALGLSDAEISAMGL